MSQANLFLIITSLIFIQEQQRGIVHDNSKPLFKVVKDNVVSTTTNVGNTSGNSSNCMVWKKFSLEVFVWRPLQTKLDIIPDNLIISNSTWLPVIIIIRAVFIVSTWKWTSYLNAPVCQHWGFSSLRFVLVIQTWNC